MPKKKASGSDFSRTTTSSLLMSDSLHVPMIRLRNGILEPVAIAIILHLCRMSPAFFIISANISPSRSGLLIFATSRDIFTTWFPVWYRMDSFILKHKNLIRNSKPSLCLPRMRSADSFENLSVIRLKISPGQCRGCYCFVLFSCGNIFNSRSPFKVRCQLCRSCHFNV